MYNTTLRMLDLRGNGFGDAGAGEIARALRALDNPNLQEVDLAYNDLHDDGACALANVRKA